MRRGCGCSAADSSGPPPSLVKGWDGQTFLRIRKCLCSGGHLNCTVWANEDPGTCATRGPSASSRSRPVGCPPQPPSTRPRRHRRLVEVLAAVVVDGGCSGVGVASGNMYLPQRHAGVELAHDEPGPQHVRVYRSQPCPLADRADPAVRSSPVKAFPVPAEKVRSPIVRSIVRAVLGTGDEAGLSPLLMESCGGLARNRGSRCRWSTPRSPAGRPG